MSDFDDLIKIELFLPVNPKRHKLKIYHEDNCASTSIKSHKKNHDEAAKTNKERISYADPVVTMPQ